jgi:hypothetical protein
MFGLGGSYLFYRAGVAYLGFESPKLLYLLGLFPSILFWSSILGKDPPHMLGIAIYCHGLILWRKERKLRWLVSLAVGVLIASAIRPWSGPILLFPVAVLMIGAVRNPFAKLATLGLICWLLTFSLGVLNDRFGVTSVHEVVKTTTWVSRSWAKGGSAQEVPTFESGSDLLAFAPVAMTAALFRPLPGEVMNIFGLLAGLENLFLVFLLVNALPGLSWRTIREPVVIWASTLVIVWAFVYGFISYQNLGSAARFKLQILPILLCLLLLLSRPSVIPDRAATNT